MTDYLPLLIIGGLMWGIGVYMGYRAGWTANEHAWRTALGAAKRDWLARVNASAEDDDNSE